MKLVSLEVVECFEFHDVTRILNGNVLQVNGNVACISKKDAAERCFDLRMLKLEAGFKQTSGNHPLALEQHRPEFTQN